MTLYTIGYEGIDIRRFLSALKDSKISAVIDVRKLSFSRKRDFCKNSLAKRLSRRRIDYFDFGTLGTSKRLRDKLHETGDYKTFFRNYRRFLQRNIHLLYDLKSLIDEGHSVALLCYEKDNEKCHRKIIAEQVRKMNGDSLEISPIHF
jgi:uncharacterized protein (DUF488 family)